MGMGARSERVRLFVLFVRFWHCRMSSWKVVESLTRSTAVRDCPVLEWMFGVYALAHVR